MTRFRCLVSTLSLALFLVGPLAFSGDSGTPVSQPEAGPALPTSGDASAAFARLEKLAGRWQAQSSKGWSEEVTYEVVARGSAVVQRIAFADNPDETMYTVYHLDGDRLLLTHYCEARNQPRLVLVEAGEDRLAFEFLDATNLPSRNHGHMDRAVFTFLDDDRFSSRWTWFQDGREQWLEEVVYRRLPGSNQEGAGR